MEPLVVMRAEELSQIVRVAVAEALAQATPALLDRQGLAKALATSAATVDRLRREGMPEVNVGGGSPRFALIDVLAWLKARGD